jgi:hypothetical protein
MKRFILMAALAGGLPLAAPPPVEASVNVGISFSYFQNALSPYGDWSNHAVYGNVWIPRQVRPGWRPYYYGHWVYTDYDYTWMSDDDWGWATEHYGRWFFDPRLGWVWVPGYEWAPAWVDWRYGDGYAGWAPLPPRVDVFYSRNYYVPPSSYCFVDSRRIFEPSVYRHAVPVQRNVTIINVTQNVTNYNVVDHRIVNRGPDIRTVERSIGHAVPRVRVREAQSVTEARGAGVRNGEVAVYRPVAHGKPQETERHDVEKKQQDERDKAVREAAERRAAEQRKQTERQDAERRAVERKPQDDRKGQDDRDKAVRDAAERRAAEQRKQTERQEADRRAVEKRQQEDRDKAAREAAERRAAEQRQQSQRQEAERRAIEHRQQDEARDRAAREAAERRAAEQRHETQRMEQQRADQQRREEDRRRADVSARQSQERERDARNDRNNDARSKPQAKPTPKPPRY